MGIISSFPGGGKKQLRTEIILWDKDWTVPEGVKSINVRLFGGGGGGGGGQAGGGGGGGGGGHMVFDTIAVTPLDSYSITIGQGGIGGIGGGEGNG
ncbi:MAG TPA: hypothetical protein PKX46_00005, partial [Clostridia bacterium]|nr:hypothetical protein [Clostridia bacterium]